MRVFAHWRRGSRVAGCGARAATRAHAPHWRAHATVGQARVAAFAQGLQQSGWTIGRNVQIDTRWGDADADRIRSHAAELVALAPDVILASGNAAVAPMLQATRTVPIVFAIVPDPVGAGFVDSLARPGGNATGFIAYEYSLGAKWLELLKQIAPDMTRAAVLRDPALASGHAYGHWRRTHLAPCVHNYSWLGRGGANPIWTNGSRPDT